MATNYPADFWSALEQIWAEHRLVIDRPGGTAHPRYPSFVYPLDYGYLDGTQAQDGGGVDVWRGCKPELGIVAVCVTIDCWKQDSEIKVLFGCSESEQQLVVAAQSGKSMRCLLVTRDGIVSSPTDSSNDVAAAKDLWEMADSFSCTHPVIVDRPQGSSHPRFPEFTYELDYGYLDGTQAPDGGGIDVWIGSQALNRVTAICLVADWTRHECEVKLLLGCTPSEIATVGRVHSKGLLITRP